MSCSSCVTSLYAFNRAMGLSGGRWTLKSCRPSIVCAYDWCRPSHEWMSVRKEDLGMAFLLRFAAVCSWGPEMLARCFRKRSDIAMRSPTAEVDLHWHPDPQGQHTCQVVEIGALDFDIVNRPTLAIGSQDLGVVEEPPEVCVHDLAFRHDDRRIIVGHSDLVGRAAVRPRQARHQHENRRPAFQERNGGDAVFHCLHP